jgi:hypothetical protein
MNVRHAAQGLFRAAAAERRGGRLFFKTRWLLVYPNIRPARHCALMHCVYSRVSLGTPQPAAARSSSQRCSAVTSGPDMAAHHCLVTQHAVRTMVCRASMYRMRCSPASRAPKPAAPAILAGSPEYPQRPHTVSPARYVGRARSILSGQPYRASPCR